MKLLWKGDACVAPGLGGLLIQPGEHEYADEHAEKLLAIGLTEPPAPAKRKAAASGESKE